MWDHDLWQMLDAQRSEQASDEMYLYLAECYSLWVGYQAGRVLPSPQVQQALLMLADDPDLLQAAANAYRRLEQ